ncbi:GNAT family N-acetyltransferase [Photobacterium angustum]|uniref:N-acetyltransferase n=1 Tax=Photobacterium angustum TaxID=661 RepID=A0A855SBH0_PHOAN|nr:GNAT family N-acetyltransferase [Photobacterium angustum]KJF79999.1 GNAT family acetyltransferase [Photobacterium damselae subsp. damselae]KJG15484.1 GNAT family acetyltransferase [Photobacterium angustum]KJG20665.1 GNAT family acetyltransferase [Photobacterium angustum]KJG27623.1 GNAT family acetyltransferase [Photobacterium angustum]KJG40097.1 GNAT family acetyltransferase [Photobacterium angustum]
MNVRKANKQDSSKLFEFIEYKAEFDRLMKGFDGKISTTKDKIERTLFGDYPFAHALLLEIDGEVQGFALFHYRYSSFRGEPSIWLDDLLVVGEHRSKGYGAELMHALKKEAEKSLTSHISWTASPYNIKAHEFYKKLGAEVERMEGQRPYFRWTI